VGGRLVHGPVLGDRGAAVARRADALQREGPVPGRGLVVVEDVDGERVVLLAVGRVVDRLERRRPTRAGGAARAPRRRAGGGRRRRGRGADRGGDGGDPVVEVGLGRVAVTGGVAEGEDLPVPGDQVVALARSGGGHVDDPLVGLVQGRAVVAGVTEGEDRPVSARQPVAPAGRRRDQGLDAFVE